MAWGRDTREQQIIDHEVRLSRSRAIIHDYVAAQQGRTESREVWRQTAWMRRQIADMIARSSPDELEALGLTDDLIRELRLGTSLQDARARVHIPPRGSHASELNPAGEPERRDGPGAVPG